MASILCVLPGCGRLASLLRDLPVHPRIAVEKAFLHHVFSGSANHDLPARAPIGHDAQVAFNKTILQQEFDCWLNLSGLGSPAEVYESLKDRLVVLPERRTLRSGSTNTRTGIFRLPMRI